MRRSASSQISQRHQIMLTLLFLMIPLQEHLDKMHELRQPAMATGMAGATTAGAIDADDAAE